MDVKGPLYLHQLTASSTIRWASAGSLGPDFSFWLFGLNQLSCCQACRLALLHAPRWSLTQQLAFCLFHSDVGMPPSHCCSDCDALGRAPHQHEIVPWPAFCSRARSILAGSSRECAPLFLNTGSGWREVAGTGGLRWLAGARQRCLGKDLIGSMATQPLRMLALPLAQPCLACCWALWSAPGCSNKQCTPRLALNMGVLRCVGVPKNCGC